MGEGIAIAAVGVGVDSVAMVMELASQGRPPDLMLFADTKSEKPETYEYLERYFRKWAERKNILFDIVSYEVKGRGERRNWPQYSGLEENCIVNATLPSLAFGFKSCSQKFKVQPQDAYVNLWQPALDEWAAGRKVVKYIGYDCDPQDAKRYAAREGHTDDKYEYVYPLREWGWTRRDCEERILAEGLPVPPKSACFFCPSMKPHEVRTLSKPLLRRCVLMEARAAPRLTSIEGLWRKATLGMRGSVAKPGSFTQFIRDEGLLPAHEVDRIVALAPQAIVRFVDAVDAEGKPLKERASIGDWLRLFDELGEGDFDEAGIPDLFRVGSDPVRRSRSEAAAA